MKYWQLTIAFIQISVYFSAVFGEILRGGSVYYAAFHRVYENMMLTNGKIKEVTKQDITDCVDVCMDIATCQSINAYFNQSLVTCQLMKRDRSNATMQEFVKKDGWAYYDTVANQYKMGSNCMNTEGNECYPCKCYDDAVNDTRCGCPEGFPPRPELYISMDTVDGNYVTYNRGTDALGNKKFSISQYFSRVPSTSKKGYFLKSAINYRGANVGNFQDTCLVDPCRDGLTVSFWIAITALHHNAWILLTEAVHEKGFYVTYINGGTLRIIMSCGDRKFQRDTVFKVIERKWNHILFTLNENESKMYVYLNGRFADVNSGTPSTHVTSASRSLYISRYQKTYRYFDIDDIAIWCRHLTETEVFEVYNYKP